MKKNWIYFLLGFVAVALLGAKQFYDNTLILGNSQASNKEVIFDIGQGANNPKIKWDNSDGILKVSNGSAIFSEAGSPVGSIMAYAGSSAPDGWILAQGQAVSRTTYAKLFAAIGTTYGVGDGSTTFNLPDLRGRIVAGVDAGINRLTASGLGTSAVLAATGGGDVSSAILSHSHTAGSYATTIASVSLPSATHTHNIAHNHIVARYTSPTWYFTKNSVQSDGSITIDTSSGSEAFTSSAVTTGGTGDARFANGTESGDKWSTGVMSPPSGAAGATAASGTPSATTASITGSNSVGGTSGLSGAGSSFSIVQPTIVLNYIIKA
jgi:microcystin-dependent protein